MDLTRHIAWNLCPCGSNEPQTTRLGIRPITLCRDPHAEAVAVLSTGVYIDFVLIFDVVLPPLSLFVLHTYLISQGLAGSQQ